MQLPISLTVHIQERPSGMRQQARTCSIRPTYVWKPSMCRRLRRVSREKALACIYSYIPQRYHGRASRVEAGLHIGPFTLSLARAPSTDKHVFPSRLSGRCNSSVCSDSMLDACCPVSLALCMAPADLLCGFSNLSADG
jgi:hypothetical protein